MVEVKVEVSARHLHLTKEDFEKLFGAGKTLTVKRNLSMAEYFVAEEKVEVIGPKGSFMASIVGPFREYSQVETSLSEAKNLGLEPTVAVSGDLTNALPIKLKGTIGEVELAKGLIVAQRHLHASTKEAEQLGLAAGQMVKVQISGPRGGVLDNVIVRIQDNFILTVHLDIDEGNAFNLPHGGQGLILL